MLGGDGTMLRALRSTLGSGTPVLGINFGRVGFLTTANGAELEAALMRALAGEFRVVDLCTLEALGADPCGRERRRRHQLPALGGWSTWAGRLRARR